MVLTAISQLLPAISPNELRSHLRNTNTEESTLMLSYILAMQADIEICCERSVTVRKHRMVLPSFPSRRTTNVQQLSEYENGKRETISGQAILLPRVPLARIDSISYFDQSNAQQSYSDFNLLTGSEPAELTQALDQDWPCAYRRRDAVTITFWAGNLIPVRLKPAAGQDPAVLLNTTGYTIADGDEITLSVSGNSNEVLGDVAVLPDGVEAGTTYFVRDATATTFSVAATAGGEAIVLAEPSASGTALDMMFVGAIDPWTKLCILQAAGGAYGKRCLQGGSVCSDSDFATNAMYQRLRWRSPVEFV